MKNVELTIEFLKKEKPFLQVIDISTWSHSQWLDFRHNGIGASEIGTLLDMNDYTTPIELFNYKTGYVRTSDMDNNAMFMGRYLESVVGDLWCYYDINDGSWESLRDNYESEKTKVRNYCKPDCYVVNPKYPHLFLSLDGFFIHEGKICPLEIKTISKMSADKWETGIPQSYILQLHQAMIILESDYSELAMLMDGRIFNVYPIPLISSIAEHIKKESELFWDKVIRGRELVGLMRTVAEDVDIEEEYRELEPPVKVLEDRAFNDFLHERFRAIPDKTIPHTEEIEQKIIEREEIREQEAEIGKIKSQLEAEIKYFMGDACRMETSYHRVTYNPDKNGRRTLRINKL